MGLSLHSKIPNLIMPMKTLLLHKVRVTAPGIRKWIPSMSLYSLPLHLGELLPGNYLSLVSSFLGS